MYTYIFFSFDTPRTSDKPLMSYKFVRRNKKRKKEEKRDDFIFRRKVRRRGSTDDDVLDVNDIGYNAKDM